LCIFSVASRNGYKYTGKERDTESGLDYFGARYYGSSMGRFQSPDPVIITPERLANPQELNLYAYVANNPLRFIDPTGEVLQCAGDDKSRGQCFSDLQDGWPRLLILLSSERWVPRSFAFFAKGRVSRMPI
jgi:RHS repeat-associated protein